MFTMRIVEVAISHCYVICLNSIHCLETEMQRDHECLVFLKPLPLGEHSPLRSGQLNRLMQPQEFETAIIQFELNIQKMIKWRLPIF